MTRHIASLSVVEALGSIIILCFFTFFANTPKSGKAYLPCPPGFVFEVSGRHRRSAKHLIPAMPRFSNAWNRTFQRHKRWCIAWLILV